MPGIYLVIGWYIPRICFLNETWFSSIWIHTLLWWVCAVHRTILLQDDSSILQCYMMVKKIVGYVWDISWIYMVYIWNMHQIGFIDVLVQRKWWNCLHELELACTYHFQCWGHENITQNAVFIQHEYLKGIYQAYTKYIHIICPLQPSCEPSLSPKRAWMSRTWTFCGSFPFWLLTVLRL